MTTKTTSGRQAARNWLTDIPNGTSDEAKRERAVRERVVLTLHAAEALKLLPGADPRAEIEAAERLLADIGEFGDEHGEAFRADFFDEILRIRPA